MYVIGSIDLLYAFYPPIYEGIGTMSWVDESIHMYVIRSIDQLYTFQPAIWEGIGTMVEATKKNTSSI